MNLSQSVRKLFLRNFQFHIQPQTLQDFCSYKDWRNMPKKSTRGAGKGQTKGEKIAPVPDSVVQGPVTLTKEGDFAISIQVKPGAKTNAITDVSDESVSIQIAAPPVDGEANTAIVKYFAELLNLKKADLSLRGGKSRQKIVTVHSSAGSSVEDILRSLKNQQGR